MNWWTPWRYWGREKKEVTQRGTEYVTHETYTGDWYEENSAVRSVIDTIAQAVATVPVKFYTRGTHVKRFTLEDVTSDPYTLLFVTSTTLLQGYDVVWGITRDGMLEIVEDNTKAVDRYVLYVRLSGRAWATKLDSLKKELVEARNAEEYRAEMWKQGGRIAGWIEVPDGELTDTQHKRLAASWNEFSRGGARAGQTPILEYGMKYHDGTLSAKDNEWEASQKLLLQHVANVYNLPPAILTGGATERERAYLYSDTINGIVRVITSGTQELLNHAYTVRFNVDSKLSGSFLERAQILSTLAGRPVLGLDEARAIIDYPATGDNDIVTPLNVTIGGKLSPQDGGEILPYYENEKLLTQQNGDNE